MEMASKLVHTNTCLPYHYIVGDGIAHLTEMQSRGVDPNKKAAVFLPKASGPCRFGQYSVVMRKVLDDNGFQDVPIVSPGAATDYRLEPGMANSRTKTLKPLALKGILAHDILENAMMRVRPYEKNPGDAERTYQEAYGELQEIVRQNPTISRLRTFMTKQTVAFRRVMKEGERKPIVLMNGEIFVRCHERANDDLARLLESHGVEVMIEPTFSWMDYVNRTVMREARKIGDYGQLAHSLVNRVYMDFAHHSLFAPFKQLLAGREFHDPYHFIDAVHRRLIIDSAATGEAPISVGQVSAFLEGELPSISGIAHVSPFECMQENVATSMMEALSRDYKAEAKPGQNRVVPLFHAVYGHSRQPNFDAMADVFVEKVYIYRDLQKEK
jgi:predicted nucleotide-binding protein (sugar kinase/HSP70/actin superfamily)